MSRLRELLKSKGITIDQLSGLTGISRSKLEEIVDPSKECRVTLATAREIARALGVRSTTQVFADREIIASETRVGQLCGVCHMTLPLAGGECENSHRRAI